MIGSVMSARADDVMGPTMQAKFECLKIAIQFNGASLEDTIKMAQQIYDFISLP